MFHLSVMKTAVVLRGRCVVVEVVYDGEVVKPIVGRLVERTLNGKIQQIVRSRRSTSIKESGRSADSCIRQGDAFAFDEWGAKNMAV